MIGCKNSKRSRPAVGLRSPDSPGSFHYTRAFRAEEMDRPAFGRSCVFLFFFRSDSDTSVESVIALQRNCSDGPWWTNNVFL